MRLRDRRHMEKPDIIIIPMIDIMFFLLVFFMLSTLYMVNLKTVDINMPQAAHAETQLKVTYVVTMKNDGSLWLEDKPIAEQELLKRVAQQQANNPQFTVVVRADQKLDYGMVIGLLDKIKGAGVTKVGLAADSAGGQ
ncbi:putative biopolymer transport protein ExbD/TolR [Selenomonas ruminantium subsp. lactilytica TAM6421]|uniref:Putative biopolymer transport protein ExbD/TolR n=1 Tax=Selenomonas ruminantium subsp. lactilytica (strain NBRC 103574 / TAM6421) TaxID=927704 RepID=I0GPF5_SELRL|nr:biopolymer transporter ExbD [Selenomonas ruminantium]BAL82642.1 putative biopolymer transport protein ExbD/TolR [Selenomonas ruminantium subsp. lactilytica TAM6421]